MNIKPKNHLRQTPSTPRKTPKQILQTKHIFNKIKRTTIDSAGEGVVWQFMSSQNIYFQSFAGDNIYFHQTSEQTIYFKI